MHEANLNFAEIANPHSWLLTADNLHAQALSLNRLTGRAVLTRIDYRTGVSTTWDGVNKSVFLFGGFALENAIEAFLVYENPQWISHGKLSKRLRSHSLVSLQKQSRQIPYKARYVNVLWEFETGLESWARYPCSIAVETSMDETVMRSELWDGYLRLMRAYGKSLKKLLSSGWHGPHGYYGKWSFTGEYLATEAS